MLRYHLVSRDAQRALEEFSQEFALAFAQGAEDQWAKELGYSFASRALKTTFPIPVSAAGYHEFRGDVKYRQLFEKSLELIPKTWQDGVSELASVIEAPDFVGWADEPMRIASAGASLPNEIIAARLEANPSCWTGKQFFAADHPLNVFRPTAGTFQNDFSGAGTDPTLANLSLAKQRFRSIKGANGKPLGLRLTHILAPPAQEETWKDLLEQDLVIQAINGGTQFGAVNNRHKGTVKLVIADQLSDDDKWYPVALNKPGMHPWIVQDQGSPEEIRSDKSSALYQQKLMVGVAYVLEANGELALPHCVQRWAGEEPEPESGGGG